VRFVPASVAPLLPCPLFRTAPALPCPVLYTALPFIPHRPLPRGPDLAVVDGVGAHPKHLAVVMATGCQPRDPIGRRPPPIHPLDLAVLVRVTLLARSTVLCWRVSHYGLVVVHGAAAD
jgi:hypothetical protein